MKFRGGEFSTGTTGNFQPELTNCAQLLAELPSEAGVKVDYQVAAPFELRTPNLHRAKNRSIKSADGRIATEAARLERKEPQT